MSVGYVYVWATYLGSLDMIVEVVTESLDMRDSLCALLRYQMAWEKDFTTN